MHRARPPIAAGMKVRANDPNTVREVDSLLKPSGSERYSRAFSMSSFDGGLTLTVTRTR